MTHFSADAEIPAHARGAALAFGKFDGVHVGHQALLKAVSAVAQARGVATGAAVLEPHPRRVFEPDARPFLLQNSRQRARALAATGAGAVFDIHFDRDVSTWSDWEFCERVFAQRLGASHVGVGAGFRFGAGRKGDAASLKAAGEKLGFTAEAIAEVDAGGGEKVSSTAIREAIARGDMSDATRMLGRPWAIEGEVKRGFARGRGLGFATANVPLGDYQRPKLGVYAVRADLGDGVWRAGVASVGVNPTFGALSEPLLEAHLFDFDADLYGRTIEVQLVAHLRDEATFESAEAMTRQIEADAAQARALLS